MSIAKHDYIVIGGIEAARSTRYSHMMGLGQLFRDIRGTRQVLVITRTTPDRDHPFSTVFYDSDILTLPPPSCFIRWCYISGGATLHSTPRRQRHASSRTRKGPPID